MSMQIVTFRDALNQAIDEEMQRDENVYLLGEEVAEYHGAYKVSKGLWEKYSDKRVIDTPITEAGFTGLAIGSALTGLRPIVEYMSFNFSFVAFDQICSNALKMHYMSGGRFKVPVVFRGCNGAAACVSCQHSHNVEPFFAHLPGCIVVAPSNPYDAKGLLKAAIRSDDPVFFLENEMLYNDEGQIPNHEYLIAFGKGRIAKEGSDVTLISYSRMLKYCLEVAESLEKKGVSVQVVDLRSIKPLDISLIKSCVQKTHRAVVVEEGHYFSGICSEVIAQINEHCFDDLDSPVIRVCQKETPLPYAPNMQDASMPNTNRILHALKTCLKGVKSL
jgi:pyruvate dehydrogenase E1 component beta subunit